MATHSATVTEIEELAPAVIQLTVALHDRDFRFEPGQWVNFRFPEGVSRAYTIASAPQRPDISHRTRLHQRGEGHRYVRRLRCYRP